MKINFSTQRLQAQRSRDGLTTRPTGSHLSYTSTSTTPTRTVYNIYTYKNCLQHQHLQERSTTSTSTRTVYNIYIYNYKTIIRIPLNVADPAQPDTSHFDQYASSLRKTNNMISTNITNHVTTNLPQVTPRTTIGTPRPATPKSKFTSTATVGASHDGPKPVMTGTCLTITPLPRHPKVIYME